MTSKSLSLTPAESLLQKCLLACSSELPSPPTLRFTGGWVRDKLLGVPSHDIDVALSNMTGFEFGRHLKSYIDGHWAVYESEAQELGIKAQLSGLHQIAANPEKSKHLETVTTRLFGFDLDFVNLRKETYSEDSRNPKMEFGTPEEDALRRDATVNALFYNLHTREVEDFTSQGLQDMNSKVIRTPLAPYQTFKDDPLRVLRLIRFASRLGYEIEQSSLAAMKDPKIHDALRLKISRERVGIEVEKMVTGPDPRRALILIHDLDLYPCVFGDLGDQIPTAVVIDLPGLYDELQKILQSNSAAIDVLNLKEADGTPWYLAAYTPFSASDSDRAASVLREALKVPNLLTNLLNLSIRNRPQIQDLVFSAWVTSPPASPNVEPETEPFVRSKFGMPIRNMGRTWRLQILYSMLADMSDKRASVYVIERYSKLLAYIRDSMLEDVADLRPIVNGRQIVEAMGVKTGRWMTRALEMVMTWQLDHPDGEVGEVLEMLRGRRRELGI